MADDLKPTGFWSYARSDDEASGGRLGPLRLSLARHLQMRVGRDPRVQIFQDQASIPPGAGWQRQIRAALNASSFFIAIITPAFLQSEMCCQEVMQFRRREAALRRDDLILPLHYIDVDDVDPARRGEVFDPAVLTLLRQRQWIDFRALRLRDPASEAVEQRLDALALSIRGRLRGGAGRAAAAPPPVPNQGLGQHFVLDEAGVIRFAPPEALDPEGNNIALLHSLHPQLRELVASLAGGFANTNAHRHLAGCLERYRKAIDRPFEEIDFGGLLGAGVILTNGQTADAADKEEPLLDPAVKSTLDSVMQLHGMFITATQVGLTTLAREAAWRRRPEETQRQREAAVAITGELHGKPDVIGPEEAVALHEAAQQIGQGPNPERSGTIGTGMLRNVAIVMTAGATVAALPVAAGLEFGTAGAVTGALFALLGSEALIRSTPFGSVAHAITSRLNQLSEAELRDALVPIAQTLRAQLQFVRYAEPALRRLAGDREAFGWLHRSLDWIKRPVAAAELAATETPAANPPPAPPPRFPVPKLVLIPDGSFVMGIPEAEAKREKTENIDGSARRLHTVIFARAFRLGKYPVTRAEYAAFVDAAGYDKDGGRWRDPGFEQTARDPVVNVSAVDAEAYAAWLNEVAGSGWRLPSEAEWEYAARSRTATARYWGNGFREASHYAHVSQGKRGTAPVGSKLPNAFGLHDMLGNVWEWTADPWHGSYDNAPDDGSAWITEGDPARRVLRGGSWVDYPGVVRAGFRHDIVPGSRLNIVGFRLARTSF